MPSTFRNIAVLAGRKNGWPMLKYDEVLKKAIYQQPDGTYSVHSVDIGRQSLYWGRYGHPTIFHAILTMKDTL